MSPVPPGEGGSITRTTKNYSTGSEDFCINRGVQIWGCINPS